MPPYDLNTLDGQVADLIMHGERYDPTMEKLDLRFDPVLFWIRHPRVFGIPILKRSAIILENLYRKTVLLAIEQDVLNQERNRNTRFNNIANFR